MQFVGVQISGRAASSAETARAKLMWHNLRWHDTHSNPAHLGEDHHHGNGQRTPVSQSHSEDGSEPRLDASNAAQRSTLLKVLALNLSQVLLAGAVGFLADSTGLLGAALDNLADAVVYIVSLYAVGKGLVAKTRAARMSGVLLLVLASALLVEVVRRFVMGSDPIGIAMIIAAIANAAINLLCMRLLSAHRKDGVHMKASWIFTTNDMLANLGIAASGLAVMLFQSPLPDLLIGLAVVAIVFKGGWDILGETRKAPNV